MFTFGMNINCDQSKQMKYAFATWSRCAIRRNVILKTLSMSINRTMRDKLRSAVAQWRRISLVLAPQSMSAPNRTVMASKFLQLHVQRLVKRSLWRALRSWEMHIEQRCSNISLTKTRRKFGISAMMRNLARKRSICAFQCWRAFHRNMESRDRRRAEQKLIVQLLLRMRTRRQVLTCLLSFYFTDWRY